MTEYRRWILVQAFHGAGLETSKAGATQLALFHEQKILHHRDQSILSEMSPRFSKLLAKNLIPFRHGMIGTPSESVSHTPAHTPCLGYHSRELNLITSGPI